MCVTLRQQLTRPSGFDYGSRHVHGGDQQAQEQERRFGVSSGWLAVIAAA
jgi:hypothetical protein